MIVLQISWIRRRDFHVLTSSTFTYTNDERFQVLHAEGSDDWTLQIKYVQERDNGTYECQHLQLEAKRYETHKRRLRDVPLKAGALRVNRVSPIYSYKR
ncbi:hypothetical protein M0802_001454 [Mischocyttarus mexicanus]|nr:hypothetical protein M0802_001454 [Mischocyttarus mexicanus]